MPAKASTIRLQPPARTVPTSAISFSTSPRTQAPASFSLARRTILPLHPARISSSFSSSHAVVGTTGWYTLQHVFQDIDGYLAVKFNLIDADGHIVWSNTIETSDPIPAEVGGNRYGWFTDVTVPGGLAIDNLTLTGPSLGGAFSRGCHGDRRQGTGQAWSIDLPMPIRFMAMDVVEVTTSRSPRARPGISEPSRRWSPIPRPTAGRARSPGASTSPTPRSSISPKGRR